MKNIEKTLAEQLKITPNEIDRRKQLLMITKEDEELLLSFKPVITANIHSIIKSFYGFMTSFKDVANIIGDAETMRRLTSAMHIYVLEIFEGHYDEEYVNKRLRIGIVHQRIGVSSELYMAAIYQLQLQLHNTVSNYELGNKYGVSIAIKHAITKMLMFDMQFVLDTYFSSLVTRLEQAQDELQQYTLSLENIIDERTRELEELSISDELTGIYNQRAFFENLHRAIATAERYRESLVLCYFDLNGFKQVNDKEGHQAGDEILRLTGEVIKKTLREADLGFRYGGDEFAIILPRTTLDEADTFAQRLINNFKANKQLKVVSFCMGLVGVGPEKYIDHERFLQAADKEMYAAKERSKNRKGFYLSSTKIGA